MNNVLDYFERVHTLISGMSRMEVERYEEQLLSTERGNLRIRLRFFDNSLLEISEALHISGETLNWLSYRYHYQKPDASIIFRYDSTPHHPEVATHPEHKHAGTVVVAAVRPSIETVIAEVSEHVRLKE